MTNLVLRIMVSFFLLRQAFIRCQLNWENDTISTIVYLVKEAAELQYEVDKILKEGTDSLVESSFEDQLNMFPKPVPASLHQYRCAYIELQTSRELKRITGLDLEQLFRTKEWRTAVIDITLQDCLIPRNMTCNGIFGKFRTFDGSCNNEKNPDWGMANITQKRYLRPDYSDGIDAPRDSVVTSGSIPSAREVSNVLFKAKSTTTEDTQLTILHMSFGQFLNHDLIFTPTVTDDDGWEINCCDSRYKSSECIPIDIPNSDPNFSHRCMNFVRSLPSVYSYGADPLFSYVGYRNQVNGVTSFLDASNVYGSSNEKSNSLRQFTNGLLKVGLGDGLPEGKTKCFKEVPSDYCQDAGDERVNVVPSLSAVHLLFVLEHNRIARRLLQINPNWDDDILFFESRKILIAVMQHIVYNEYLPLVVGRNHMNYYNLTIDKDGGSKNIYDDQIDPTTTNVFGVAASRFGHSQITNTQEQFNKSHEAINVTDIDGTFQRPHFCEMNMGEGYHGVMRWMTHQLAAKADRAFETGVRNKLFPTKDGRTFDLPAIDIQRGRDHGMPTYNKWREWCGLSRVKYFYCKTSGLIHHDLEAKKTLASIYRSPDDIDLFAGAISERHLEGASVGPTFACILSKQFHDWKFGDRFWFENENMHHSFRSDQILQIKNTTLSSVICKNFDVDEIQPYAFMKQTVRNGYVPCKNLPEIDFSLWNSTNFDHNWNRRGR